MRAIIILALLAFPADAAARTIQQDLNVAHRYWKTEVCRGQWQVIEDAALRLRHVVASTSLTDCVIRIAPGLTGCNREGALVHEVGHFVHGLGHDGPMARVARENAPCVGERLKQQRVKARWLREPWRNPWLRS